MMHKHQKALVCLAMTLLLAFAIRLQSAPTSKDKDDDMKPVETTAKDPGPRPIGSVAFRVRGITGVAVTLTAQPAPPGAGINDPRGAGLPLRNITTDQDVFWADAMTLFAEVTTVDGAFDQVRKQPTLRGLGPGFDGNSCFMCHSQPAIGGSSPGPGTFTFPVNPQIGNATLNGANNIVPSFIRPDGPVFEVRFIRKPDGSLDGAVHQLYTIAGRSDAPSGCSLQQPDFETELARNNLAFRIATPMFGAGFVENVSDGALLANLAADKSEKAALGIAGHFNINPNDNTIGRFGWKAQEKSLASFAGEALNVESGITSELFPNEKADEGCATNPAPEDRTRLISPSILGANLTGDDASLVSSLTSNLAHFMRLNSAPSQCDFASGTVSPGIPLCLPLSDSARRGRVLFGAPKDGGVGCVLCHTDTLVTGPSPFANLNNAEFHPFSDLALHHMGSRLADGIIQGSAGPDEFRTALLWGVGQRLFLLHDGRTSDLLEAIQAHASSGDDCVSAHGESHSFKVNGEVIFARSEERQFCGSEATATVRKFNRLTSDQKQDLLNFLRSL